MSSRKKTESQPSKDTTRSRFNATKHALLAVGITPLDDEDGHQEILDDLMREKAPVGPVEIFLVKAVALHMVRWTRAVRLEGEFITSILNPPVREKDPMGDLDLQIHGAVLDEGIPATIGAGAVQQLVGVFQRYESCFAHRLLQALHELERLQRMRKGERVPAPAAADLSVHTDAGTVDSTPAALEQPKAASGDGESLRAPVTLNVNAQADAGTSGSTPAAPEPSKALLSDGDSLPAPITEDVDAQAEGGLVGSAPAEPEQGAALTGPEVTDRKVPVRDPALAWKPRAPAGPFWKR